MRVKTRDVEYNLVERRVDSINRMNKTFDEPDDDVHPSNRGGCRRCGTAEEEMIERRKGGMKKRHAATAIGVNRRGKNSE